MKTCPYCAEEILNEAIFCKHCQQSLVSDGSAILNNGLNTGYAPKKASGGLLGFGYITAFLGGWLGLVIGLSLRNSKVVTVNGEKLLKYNEQSRSHGNAMIWISIIAFILWIAISSANA